eukprot:3933178-Prymnesium_polylepis.1
MDPSPAVDSACPPPLPLHRHHSSTMECSLTKPSTPLPIDAALTTGPLIKRGAETRRRRTSLNSFRCRCCRLRWDWLWAGRRVGRKN